MTATTSPAMAPGTRTPKAAQSRRDPASVRVAAFFRKHHDARIDSEIVYSTEEIVLFRVRIALSGGGSVSAHGSSRWSEGQNAIERAESRAMVRAVSMIDVAAVQGESPEAVQDPVAIPDVRLHPGRGQITESLSALVQPITILRQPATNRQLKFIAALVKQLGLSDDMIESEVSNRFGAQALLDLERAQASELIDHFQERLRVVDVAS